MKFYNFSMAPSPRRVRIFIAEKGIEIPTVDINLREGEHLKPEFLKVNPWATVPALELDDGTVISEAMAVCRYLEDAYPEPPLMGFDAKDKGVVAMWEHRFEWDGYLAVAETLRNSTERMKGRAYTGPVSFEQIPAVAERGKKRIERFWQIVEARAAESEFMAGERYTVADITALVSLDFAHVVQMDLPESYENATRWYKQVKARPSADA